MTRLDPAKVMTDISHYFTVVHPDDREAAIAHNIAGNAAGVRYFWEGRWLQDGTIRWVTIESNPRRLPTGEVAWEGVVTDITARKQVEAELERARARERKREKLTRRTLERKLETSLTASTVAHEINQPLSSILLSVRMALERGSTDSGPGWPAALPDEAPLSSTKHGGSGIGLFVVRTTVKNHRGKIQCGRSPLGGAEVRLSLPAGRP